MPFPDWQTLSVMILAVGRLHSLWFEEVFRVPRNWMLKRRPAVAYLARCPLCISVWASACVTLLSQHPLGRFLVIVLSLSGGVILVDRLMNRPPAGAGIAQELRTLNGHMQSVTVEK